MQVVGIDDNEAWNVLCLVAGILHLGNVAFVEGKKGQASVQDQNLMNTAAALLQVAAQSLQQALLFRVIQTGGQGQAKRSSTYNVPQNAEQANGAKDALARELYSRMVCVSDICFIIMLIYFIIIIIIIIIFLFIYYFFLFIIIIFFFGNN